MGVRSLGFVRAVLRRYALDTAFFAPPTASPTGGEFPRPAGGSLETKNKRRK